MGHNQIAGVLFLLFLHISISTSFPQSILQILPGNRGSSLADKNSGHRKIIRDDTLFCESWRFTVETNDAGPWNRVPSRCVAYVQDYITGDRYRSDSEAVADYALEFAKIVEVSDGGKDAWVFDIDETLLTNVPYYQQHGFGLREFADRSLEAKVLCFARCFAPASQEHVDFKCWDPHVCERQVMGHTRLRAVDGIPDLSVCLRSNLDLYSTTWHVSRCLIFYVGLRGTSSGEPNSRSEIFDEQSFDDWVDLAEAPALPASLRLYSELKKLGFKIFLLTGRSEFQRNVTAKNLDYAGYGNWERLILRGPDDQGTLATDYKSGKRKELEDEGYRIHGSSGDQWSDLIGFAVAKRSFKLPNPMYYIA